jgi:hypothetical protein
MSETMDQGGASLGDEEIQTTPAESGASETVEGDTDTTDTGGGGGDTDMDDADADMDDADS